MDDKASSLCCCEYYDIKQERNHILACCCNCEDLDEAFESLITVRNVSKRNKTGLIATMQDRLRIPWFGGAKQIAFDAVLPVFILPVMLFLASISLWWTFFSFTTVSIFLIFISNFFVKTFPKTKFFFVWTITSLIVLFIIFEIIVIPFLEILLVENIALTILIIGFLICLHLMRNRTKLLYQIGESTTDNRKIGGRLQNCYICHTKVPDKDHHCLWFDCCIGSHNHCLFILALFFAISALVYSSNLTLTSVCHPFTLYKTILLPDDCSDVYKLFELGLSFVAAVYSLILALLLLILFLQQLLLVSLGLTFKEWNKLPLLTKLCLGLNAKRPHNQGFIKNWYGIVCWKNSHYVQLNQV